MTDLVWDETGSRYFETGVSKGIFFDMNRVGVAWNGIVSISIDPSGGELESYYFDGVKYMDRILAEDFQATISAIQTPKEFEACEGVQEPSIGMKTYFNKRAKFNMAWRTLIGNDSDSAAGYKIHIAYNCTVQPAARAYQTISDNTTPDVRSFVITTTPACGRHSYYTFSSLDLDLSDLEARLYAGDLPGCWELPGLSTPIGGGPPIGIPDDGCASLITDLEEFIHGAAVSTTITDVGGDNSRFVYGIINNGLDIIELDANGTYTVNDSAATVVGSGDILADDDDATYITSADGDLGYTIQLPPLVGYVDGSELELHIRMSITGDVNADDPDNLDADAQVFITTDATGDLPVGGFSDGTDTGMGFALASVDGTIEDYVVPLNMDPWSDSSIEDVVAALEAGAYLNIVGATNNNFDTTPEVRVYEASVVVLNDTDPDKFLRADGPVNYSEIAHNIYDGTDTDNQLEASVSNYVDFKVLEVAQASDADGDDKSLIFATSVVGAYLAELKLCLDSSIGTGPIVKWYWGTEVWAEEIDLNKWYRVQWDWAWDSYNVKIVERDSNIVLHDSGATSTEVPWTQCYNYGGFIGDSDKSYEVMLDNAKMQVHCHEEAPVDPWTCFDLSTAVPFLSKASQTWAPLNTPMAIYSGGQIHSNPSWGSTATFGMPGFTLDPTKTYEFRATYDTVGYQFGIMQQNPSWATFSDNWELGFTFPTASEMHLTVGPGIDDWNSAIANGYQTLIRFDVSDGLTSLCYKEV